MCLETVSRSYYESGLHFNIKHFMHYEINVYFKNRDRLKTIFPDSVLYLIYRYLFQYIIIRRNKTNDGDIVNSIVRNYELEIT